MSIVAPESLREEISIEVLADQSCVEGAWVLNRTLMALR